MTLTRRLAQSGLVVGLYVVTTALNPASSGAIQVRLSTGLYCLAAFRPDLIPALALGNALANLLVGQGALDAALGLVVGLLTSTAVYLAGKTGKTWLVPVPSGPGGAAGSGHMAVLAPPPAVPGLAGLAPGGTDHRGGNGRRPRDLRGSPAVRPPWTTRGRLREISEEAAPSGAASSLWWIRPESVRPVRFRPVAARTARPGRRRGSAPSRSCPCRRGD